MSEHTPGPWVAGSHGYAYPTTPKTGGRESSQKFRRVLGGGREVARVWVGDVDAEPDAAPSNFRLIAAAPELLAALRQCREALLFLSNNPAFEDDAPEFNECGVGYEACRVAVEAINHAEGRGE